MVVASDPSCHQAASASRKVFDATASVDFTEGFLEARGNVPKTLTIGRTRGQDARVGATSVPVIHLLTAFCEQKEASAPVTLCPTPGTTINLPCGKFEMTSRAFTVGVRRSIPPFNA